jgi:23S rRNA (cytidine1920-2'-O)/16S rRNA (cytidine1409-2'-O)-methyltransferase
MSKRARDRSGKYVSRGGDKLERAIQGFGVDLVGLVAADLGSNVGGFTDCLLQHGVVKVYAVETGYGVLEWKLRQDDRVVVMERTNALHVALPESVDLVVADVGWTSLTRVVPHALSLLNDDGFCIALLKPQYEADRANLVNGHVDDETAQQIGEEVVRKLNDAGCPVAGHLDPGLEARGRNPERFLMISRPVDSGL